jgi:hypothetical protein
MRSDELSGLECVSAERRASAPACSPSRISCAASIHDLAVGVAQQRQGAGQAVELQFHAGRGRWRGRCQAGGTDEDQANRLRILSISLDVALVYARGCRCGRQLYRTSQTAPYARPEPISAPATRHSRNASPAGCARARCSRRRIASQAAGRIESRKRERHRKGGNRVAGGEREAIRGQAAWPSSAARWRRAVAVSTLLQEKECCDTQARRRSPRRPPPRSA